ncbi:MAG: 4-hydroxy-tetrahydrodipicolinate reductase [Acidimicrobiales bacterium]
MAAEPIAVGVVGAGGRMGRTVCDAIAADPDLHLVAAVDPHVRGTEAPGGVAIERELTALTEAGAQVAVDFTIAPAARETLPWLAEHGIHAVVGTTGFDDHDLDTFRGAFTSSNCLIAPNFAIGAVVMMRFAELAAPFFETAEVIELHHDNKRDAPSGTAMATVARLAAASDRWAPDPTEDEVVPGARGGASDAGIRVHAVRLRGLVAHQEVLLGTTGQTLTIRHDSYDRSSFMPGVLVAIKRIGELPGLTVGLDGVLGL